MTILETSLEKTSSDACDGDLFELAFSLGWAAADESHLQALPQAITRLLGVTAVRLAVVRWDGNVQLEHAYPPSQERAAPQLAYEFEKNLGTESTLRLSVESSTELTPAQSDLLNRTVRLVHAALDCILIRQRDRDALGAPFTRLSDREWQICLALEKPDGEKQIASAMSCSRHTVHSYVKSLYRKLQAQSRLQVLDQLKQSRERLRRQAFSGPGLSVQGEGGTSQ